MGVMMEKSQKYCNIKAITCLNNDFPLFICKIGTKNLYDKKIKIYSVKYFIIIEIRNKTW